MKLNKYSTEKVPKDINTQSLFTLPNKSLTIASEFTMASRHHHRYSTSGLIPISGEESITRTEMEKLKNSSSPELAKAKSCDEIDNDKYIVEYYYSQMASGLIINITHLFLGPLFLIPLRFIYGKNLLHAMFFDFSVVYFVVDFLNWAWFGFTYVFLYLRPEINAQMSIVYIATGSAILLRQLLVSLKYGFYTKKTWKKMTETWVDQGFTFSNLLLFMWVMIPIKIAEEELLVSLKKQKVDPEVLVLTFAKLPSDCIIDGEEEGENDVCVIGNKIKIITVAKYLVKEAAKHQKTYELIIIKIFGYAYVFSFVLLRYYAFGMAGFRADPLEIVYTLFSGFKAYIASTQFVSFIAAGLYDFKRRNLLIAQCTGMISKVDHKYSLFRGTDRPMLDLNDPLTIISWYYLRRTFLDFGKRYTLRIFLYASLVLPICIIVICMLFLQCFGVIGISYNYYLVPGFMLTLEVLAVIIYMSFTGLALNRSFPVHRDLLLERFIKTKNKENASIDTLRNLAYVIERLKHDEIYRPVNILGIPITDSFMLKIFIVGVSGLFAVIQLGLHHS